MAGQANITNVVITTLDNVRVDFTYTGGASSDLLYLQRARAVQGIALDWVTVRRVSRGSLTNIVDYGASFSDMTYDYRIMSKDTGGGIQYGDTMGIKLPCNGITSIAPISNTSNYIVLPYVTDRDSDYEINSQAMEFAGRSYPVYERGMNRTDDVSIKFFIETPQEVYIIQNMINEGAIWYRDFSDRSFFAMVTGFSRNDTIAGYEISMDVHRVEGEITT